MALQHTRQPVVSVITPAYNAAPFIAEAIASILKQTFAEFEMIIVDDGSDDQTAEIVASFNDDRIRFGRQKRSGVAAARNHAIGLSRGLYLAFHDADDMAFPERLQKQMEYFAHHPEIGLVGGAAEVWVDRTPSGEYYRYPTEPAHLAFEMLFENYLVHSSVMLRRRVIDAVGLFTLLESRRHEDYELWSRVSRRFAMANLPDVLTIYRNHPGSVCGTTDFEANGIMLASENIAYAAGHRKVKPAHMALASLMRGHDPKIAAIQYPDLQQLLLWIAYRLARRFHAPVAQFAPRFHARQEILRHQWGRFYPLPPAKPLELSIPWRRRLAKIFRP